MKFIPQLLGVCFLTLLSTLPAEESKQELLASITEFHSFFDEQKGLEWKIFEQDGSATIAANPLALILLITDNHPDGKTKLWELPSVSQVQKIHLDIKQNTLVIQATQDEANDQEGLFLEAQEKLLLIKVDIDDKGEWGELLVEIFARPAE